jgi:hypothetical protein
MKWPFTAALLVLSGGFALAQSPAPGTSRDTPAGLPPETVGGGNGPSELQVPRRIHDETRRGDEPAGSTPNLPRAVGK